MRIDAHQHFWKLNRGDYDWISDEMPTLNKDYLPKDLISHLREHTIDKTILVQAATTIEETKFMLKLSESSDFIAGVVGWLDFGASNYEDIYDELKQHPKFTGLRLNIQDMQHPEEILQNNYIDSLSFFAEQQVPIDLLMLADQLPIVVECLDRVPNLRAVIDHIGKPDIANGKTELWQENMRKIAEHPQIHCKLSGMVTEADPTNWNKDDFVSYVHYILEIFGSERVMFGSDWPVCLEAAEYDEVVSILNHSLPKQITEEEKKRIFGLNASHFYKLEREE